MLCDLFIFNKNRDDWLIGQVTIPLLLCEKQGFQIYPQNEGVLLQVYSSSKYKLELRVNIVWVDSFMAGSTSG